MNQNELNSNCVSPLRLSYHGVIQIINLRILTGKKHPEIKLKRLRKV